MMLHAQLLQKSLCTLWILLAVARAAAIPATDFSLQSTEPENQHKWDTISRLRSHVGPNDKSPRDRLVDSGKQAKVLVDWPRPSEDPTKARPSAKARKRQDLHKPNNVAELNRLTKPLSVKLNAGHVGYEERHRFRGIPFGDLLDTNGDFLDDELDDTDGTFKGLQGTDLSESEGDCDTDVELQDAPQSDSDSEAEDEGEAEIDGYEDEDMDYQDDEVAAVNEGDDLYLDSALEGPGDEGYGHFDEYILEDAANDTANDTASDTEGDTDEDIEDDTEDENPDSDGPDDDLCPEGDCDLQMLDNRDGGDDIHWSASSRSKVASIQTLKKRSEPMGWQYSSRSKAGKWGSAKDPDPHALHWKSSSKSKVDPVASLQEEEAPEMPLHWESSSHSKASEMFPPYDVDPDTGELGDVEDVEGPEGFDDSEDSDFDFDFDFDSDSEDLDEFEEPPELHWSVSSQSKAADFSFELRANDQNHAKVNRASLKRKPARPTEAYVPGKAGHTGATIRIHRERKIT